MYIKKHNVKTLAIILLLFLINHLNATTTNGLTITATNNGESLTGETDYTYTNGVLTVKTTTPVTIDGNSTSTTDRIVVVTGTTATITINNVVIDVSSTENACAFDIQGNASVTLILAGTNTLKSGKNCAGLHCETTTDTDILTDTQNTASLLIKGTGKLTVTGGEGGAGIGGNKRNTTGGHGGIITIEGGEVEVTTGSNGAGIGGGNGGSGGRITIKGGKVKATGGWGGAGIGGGNDGTGGIITIEGGEVEAIPGVSAAGIGGGNYGSGGTITISGGTVKASGGSGAAAIGHGAYVGNSTSFTTTSKDGKPGNAFILSLKDIEGITDNNPLSGVIFQGSGSSSTCSGKIYGTPTLKTNATIPSNTSSSVVTLEIENGKTLVIDEGVTLTNGGKITNNGIIAVKGTFTNNGTYEGSGVIYTLGTGSIDGTSSSAISSEAGVLITFDKNAGDDAVENMPAFQVMAKSSAVTKPTERPTRNGYTFMGWGDNASSKTPITDWTTKIDADKTYYAIWKYTSSIAFKNITNNGYSYTYGEMAPTVEATVTQSGSTTASVAITYYIDADCQTKTSSSDNSGATGDGLAPKNAGTYYVKASYDGDDDNTAATTIATYTIKQKELTVNVSGAVEKEYDGTTTVSTLPTFTLDGVVSGETVTLVTTGYSLAYSSEGVGESISLTATGQLSLTGDAAANYSLKQLENLTGKINKKELIVVPTADQSIYSDEHPAYTIDENNKPVGNEITAFTGNLGVSAEGKVTLGELALADDEKSGFKAANYSLKLSATDIAITKSDKSLSQAYNEQAETLASGIAGAWKNQNITLKPADNFKIKALSGLRQVSDWQTSITLEQEGSYDFTYELLCEGRTSTSGQKTLRIQLDKTGPAITLTAVGKKVTVALSDATSGLGSCSYSWDNGSDTDVSPTSGATSYSFTLTGDAAKKHLKVVATDVAGNTTTKEEEFDFSASVDPVPPINPPVNPPFDPVPPVDPDEPVDPDDPDAPVANEKVDRGTCRIYASGSTLCIDTPSAFEAWIVTADGRLLRRQSLAPGANRVYGLREGIYIIRLSDGTTQKVRVGNG
ncbi:YDG domain-containing protein [Parabacteroides sp.]